MKTLGGYVSQILLNFERSKKYRIGSGKTEEEGMWSDPVHDQRATL